MSPTDPLIFWFSLASTVPTFGFLLWAYVRSVRKRPHFLPAEVVYQERFASGCSQKNVLTKLGGGNNCVRLVVTGKFLWVSSWFPFSLIAPIFDLEHAIALSSIVSVQRDLYLGKSTILISFRSEDGESHCLRLVPKNPEALIQSLGGERAG